MSLLSVEGVAVKSMMVLGRIESGVMTKFEINSRLVEEDEAKCGACRGTGFRMDRLEFDCSMSMRCHERSKPCADHRCYSCEGAGVPGGVMTDARILEHRREKYASKFDKLADCEPESPFLREAARIVAREVRDGLMDSFLIELEGGL